MYAKWWKKCPRWMGDWPVREEEDTGNWENWERKSSFLWIFTLSHLWLMRRRRLGRSFHFWFLLIRSSSSSSSRISPILYFSNFRVTLSEGRRITWVGEVDLTEVYLQVSWTCDIWFIYFCQDFFLSLTEQFFRLYFSRTLELGNNGSRSHSSNAGVC